MGKGSGKRFPDPRELPHAFKVLCPDDLVTAIIGRGGRIKDTIQQETGARIIASQRDEYFPGTRLRILSILHEHPAGILPVFERLVKILAECGERERASGLMEEPQFVGTQPGTYNCCVAVSANSASAIIGTKGVRVAQIRKDSKAIVSVSTEKPILDHQLVKVIGSTDGILIALRHFNDCVQEESGSPGFKGWVFEVFRRCDAGPSTHIEREQPASEPRRERSPRRSQEGSAGKHSIDDALRIMDDACMEFPAGYLEEEVIITCEMPTEKVGPMFGEQGAFVKDVRRTTCCQIHFEEPDLGPHGEDPQTQTMVIKGKMLDTYRAHAIMMKQYHDVDVQESLEQPVVDVTELQKQVEALQQQLEAATRGKGKGKSKIKSKGKGK